MNMKKAIAGVFAGAVAISAVATTMVSAKTITQAENTTTFNLADKKYKASWTTKLEGTVSGPATANTDSAKFEITFKKDASTSFDTNNYEIANVKLTISGASAANSNATVEKSIDMKVDGDKATTNLYGTGVANVNSDGIPLSVFAASGASGGTVNVSLSYDIKKKTTYDTLSSVKKDVSSDLTQASYLSAIVSPVVSGSTAYSLATAIAGGFDTKSATSAKTEYVSSGSDGYKFAANGNKVELDTIKENLTYGVADAVSGTKGSELIFTFKAPDADEGSSIDRPDINFNVSGDDFGIMINNTGKLIKTGKVKNNTITFKWDDIVNDSGLYINSVGLVNSIAVKAAKEMVLQSITVKTPALTYDTLSAGESVADTTAAITTAATAATTTAAATAATTTAAASNPKTGNAPVALAVIPVAIAAAAIIAKKRG